MTREIAMNALMRRFFGAGFGLLAAFGAAQAQPSSGAESRVKEKNREEKRFEENHPRDEERRKEKKKRKEKKRKEKNC